MEDFPVLTKEESAEIFAKAARRYLDMSTEEFLAAWRPGWFHSRPELHHRADRVLILLPLLEITE